MDIVCPLPTVGRPVLMDRCLPPGCTSGSWGVALPGHNAIIRVKPFIEHCAPSAAALEKVRSPDDSFPRLCGGGATASGRVGRLITIPVPMKSCQTCWMSLTRPPLRHGNSDELHRSSVKGMHPVHRAVFLTGYARYPSAPLWFMFLALSARAAGRSCVNRAAIFPSAAPVFRFVSSGVRNWQSRCLRQRWCCCSRRCSVLC